MALLSKAAVPLLLLLARAKQHQLSTPPAAPPPALLQVHPIPLSDIKAIHKHTPPLGFHRITLTLTNGVSLPSLYFQTVSGAGC